MRCNFIEAMRAALLLGLALSVHEASAAGPTYVLGYGSLMKEWSRIKTKCGFDSNSASALRSIYDIAQVDKDDQDCVEAVRKTPFIPVKLKGVKRGWYSRGKLQAEQVDGLTLPATWSLQALDIAPTYLGAIEDPKADCYAVIYPVDDAELAKTDKRETMGNYKASWLDVSKIEVLTGSTLPKGARVRWYAQDQSMVQEPSAQFPIVQSYVDVFIGGALELEKKYKIPGFAKNVAVTTYSWSQFWVNDRKVPYRPFDEERQGHKIVKILLEATQVPDSPLTLKHLTAVSFPESLHTGRSRLFLTDAAQRTRALDPQVLILGLVGLLAVSAISWRLGRQRGSTSEQGRTIIVPEE